MTLTVEETGPGDLQSVRPSGFVCFLLLLLALSPHIGYDMGVRSERGVSRRLDVWQECLVGDASHQDARSGQW